jgi:TPR repeat protein
MRIFVAVFCFLAALTTSKAMAQPSTTSPQQLGSSFDCRRDNGTIPRLVCADDELRLLDIEQLKLYYTLRHALPQSQQDLRAAYLEAIERIKAQCTSPNVQARACLISGLNALRQHWLSIIQSTANQSASEEARLDIRQITAAQTGLRERGLLPSNSISDGLLGTATRTALGRLQADNGQTATGFLDAESMRLLRIQSANAMPTQSAAPSTAAPQGQSTASSPQTAQRQSAQPTQTNTPANPQQTSPRSAASSAPTDAPLQEQLARAQHAIDAQDYATASRIYRPLAERGVPAAQGGMARLFINNWIHPEVSTAERQRAAFQWAQSGARGNDPASQHVLGYMVSGSTGTGGWGGMIDEREGFRWYLKAAEQGLARSQVAVGIAYSNGRGVERDDAAAARWYARAAEQQDPWGEVNLGHLYREGRGVQRNDSSAFQWYQRAASRGNQAAQVEVGSAYIEGRGVARNLSEAKRILEPIAAQNVDIAYNQTVRRARDLLVEIQRAEAAPFLSAYRSREKTLLEQVLNYTTTGTEEGASLPFWVSGHAGDHRCIMTQVNSTNGSVIAKIDIRNFNQVGFRIRGPNIDQWGGRGYTLGDERQTIPGHGNAVMERLQNAWGLAFQECPGRRSAF